MVFRKRKKNTRQRGNSSHGWGAKKKHRGKGNKGGAGMAGTGKRGDSKKPVIWNKRYFGKRGFKKKGLKPKIEAINVSDIDARVDTLLKEGKVQKDGDTFIIECSKLGFNKLLGKGEVKNNLKITVDSATQRAVKKVKDKGGEVINQ